MEKDIEAILEVGEHKSDDAQLKPRVSRIAIASLICSSLAAFIAFCALFSDQVISGGWVLPAVSEDFGYCIAAVVLLSALSFILALIGALQIAICRPRLKGFKQLLLAVGITIAANYAWMAMCLGWVPVY